MVKRNKNESIKERKYFSPSIWMSPTMNYGIVPLCSSRFGCEAYAFIERQSICASYNVQVHWPFQSMTNSHRFEYFYLERRIEATYRSNAHYYTKNRIDMTSNRSNRSALWWGCDKVRLIRMKRKIEKDSKRGEWHGLYVCVVFSFEMVLRELNKINGWPSSCIHPNRPPANFMWFIYGCSRKKWQYHVIPCWICTDPP